MGNPLDTLRELWQRLTINQRALMIIGVGLIAAISAAAVSYSTRPVMATLYSGLESKDAATVADQLRDEKIVFEVSSDGTIKVPQQHVNSLRLTFAEKGIPHSGELGYEIFDKPQLGLTDQLQKLNQRRAIEGELARTMASIEGVEHARVHLVLPEQKLFKEDRKPATGSVVLTLKQGFVLSKKQVAALAALTSYAVEGLEPEYVTILDSEGNPLTNGPRDEFAGLSSTQLEMQTMVEQELERKAQALLSDVVGPGRSRVEVTAKLNWNRVERTSEDYNPDRTATLSEESQSSEDATTGASEKIVTNYQVPRTVEKYVPEVGNIEKIWASVLIDGVYESSTDSLGVITQTYVERTPAELEKFRTMVSSALGIDANRQDELTVLSFQFNESPSKMEIIPETPVNWLSLLMKFADKLVLLVVIVLAFFAVRSVINKMSDRMPALPPGVQLATLAAVGSPQAVAAGKANPQIASPATTGNAGTLASDPGGSMSRVGNTGAVMSAQTGPKVVFKSGTSEPQTIELDDAGPSVEALRAQELLNRTVQFVMEKPDNATQILRSWVTDGAN